MIDLAIFIGDPPVREDGLCVTCLGPRRVAQSQRYAPGIAQLDPFCSAPCARKWHGASLPPGQGKERMTEEVA